MTDSLPASERPLAGLGCVIDLGNGRAKVAARTREGIAVPLPPREATVDALCTDLPDGPAIVASVVQQGLDELLSGIELATGHAPRLIGRDLPLPIPVDYATPATLGVDRVLAAAAASRRVGGGVVIVVDAGTALKVDGVSAAGRFLGGAIAPGRRALAAGLMAKAPALTPFTGDSTVLHQWPGATSEASVQLGLRAALLGAAVQLVQQAREVLGRDVPILATGGDALLVAGALGLPADCICPHLVLEGAALAAVSTDG